MFKCHKITYKVTIILLICSLPAIIFWYSQKNQVYKSNKVPKITEQPTDTIVAQGFLPLHKWHTNHGVPVYFVPTESQPIVDINISFHAGSAYDQNLLGLANLLSQSLGTATTDKNALEIARGFENYGANFNCSVDKDRFSCNLRTISNKDHLDPIFKHFISVLSKAKFLSEEITRIKQQTLIGLQRAALLPGVAVYKNMYAAIYSSDHPYGHLESGIIDSVEKISIVDLENFYKNYLVQKNAVVTIVGGIHRDLAKEMASSLLQAFPVGKPADLPLPEATIAIKDRVYQKMPSNQTHIILAQLGLKALDDRCLPLFVGNYILGGSDLNSRLFKSIREDKGYAYSVYSDYHFLQQPGPYLLKVETRNNQAKEALKILEATLQEFITSGPTAEELARAKQALIGSFKRQFSSNYSIINLVSSLAFYNYPNNYLEEYVNRISAVTIEDITKVFKQLIAREKMTLVVVGEQNL